VLFLLRSNLAWILLSLILSISLWIFVTFQKNPELTQTIGSIPVEIQNEPKTVVIQPETGSVQVRISAPSDVWPQLKLDRFKAVVDASRVGPGVQQVQVQVTTTDPRVRVEGSDPEQISLRVDPLKTKVVPVQISTQGSVPFGFQSGSPSVTPVEVTLSGPQSSVDQVTAAVVQVPLEGAVATVDQTFRPVPESTSGVKIDRVTMAPEAVVVQVPVEQKLSYKTLPVEPKPEGSVALGYQIVGIIADPTTVSLVGDPKTLNEMQFVSTNPVNVDGATSDMQVSTGFALPGTVALARPQSVVVRVLVAMVEGSKTIQVSPIVANATSGLNYSVAPGAVNVVVSGPIPVLSRLGPDDVPVTVDVRGVVTGTQTLKADVKVPQLVRLQSVQPPTVSVTIR
jgi:YbbR domain-containing protein